VEDICCQCCRRPASHSTSIHGHTLRRCCECYVKDGNPPADWHPLCMITYNQMRDDELARLNG